MITHARHPLSWRLLLGAALLITLFLYFIDEGRYSLQGLLTVGDLVVMGLYFLALCVGLFGIAALFERRPPSVERAIAVVVLGSLSGIALMVGFFALLHA